MSLMRDIAKRAGFPPKERERALWIVSENKEAFLKTAPLLDDIVKRYVRLKIILSTKNYELKGWLEQTYPHYRILPLPFNNAFSIAMFLSRCNIRTAVFPGPVSPSYSGIVSGLERRSIALVQLMNHTGSGSVPASGIEKTCEVAVELVATEDEQTDGVYRKLTLRQTSDMLAGLLGRDLKLKRDENSRFSSVSEILLQTSKNSQRKALVNWRLVNYSSLEELAEALEHPDTIMCLGNGPSSEDERLKALTYDALFRVNHSWRERSLFQHPDAVFTGGRPSMRTVDDTIFGLQTENAERRLVATRFFAPALKPVRFFNAGVMCPRLSQFDWGILRPTNGASMVAAAVALQPKKLIVAGIDLFQHPEGTYPGDTSTPNEFSPAHSLGAELRFLREMFDMYQGELVIISDILRDHLSQSGKEEDA